MATWQKVLAPLWVAAALVGIGGLVFGYPAFWFTFTTFPLVVIQFAFSFRDGMRTPRGYERTPRK
ncbi:hypothetical protein ACFSBZ_05920 [Amnibacterium flavum]|uniref:Uncharacterized protein n=1 Tax=Amnibacterium flavum TaxID=2173173 RepID=A0A2V1HNC4_9MICO|nr:hypothetical protein [Amnibacterium flavum]PVZ93995.1 hypothetical protein DDQ50_09560 [Amnibacterium flavum]